ncbi:MAG: phosphotransferase [Coxiellaceae bacterium]|nr:phosphotransferase [Coxiellaceae bacterium]
MTGIVIMANLWNKTVDITATLAKQLIENQCSLRVDHIQQLDEGWDNTAFLVNHTFIFRFPHRPFGLKCMENEIAFLPKLKPYLSFNASIPIYIGKACDVFPYSFAGYPIIHGNSLCDATVDLIDDIQFAKTLAIWLKELHAIPVNNIVPLISDKVSWQFNVEHRVKRCYENLEKYGHYFEKAQFHNKELIDIIEMIKTFSIENNFQSILHGDLYCRHIIVNEKCKPEGLIDFGDMFVGDPGIDLSVGMIFSNKAFSVFLETYEDVDSKRLALLLFHAFGHAMSFLPYAFEQKKNNLQIWAANELRRSIDELKKHC